MKPGSVGFNICCLDNRLIFEQRVLFLVFVLWRYLQSKEHYRLCRCGGPKNKQKLPLIDSDEMHSGSMGQVAGFNWHAGVTANRTCFAEIHSQ